MNNREAFYAHRAAAHAHRAAAEASARNTKLPEVPDAYFDLEQRTAGLALQASKEAQAVWPTDEVEDKVAEAADAPASTKWAYAASIAAAVAHEEAAAEAAKSK